MARKINIKGSEGSDKVPTGVKIISILFYIGAVICLIFGLIMIIGSSAMVSSLVASNPGIGLENIPSGTLVTLIVVLGVLFIVMGVIAFFIGRGIWRLRKWAKITAIVLSIIGFIFAIFSIVIGFRITQILSVLIDGCIGGYLLFSEESKRAFK